MKDCAWVSRRELLGAAGAVALASTLPQDASGQAGREIPPGAPRIAANAWKGLLTGHPRILGPADVLKAKAAANSDLFQAIRRDDSLLATGIAHAVEPGDAARIAPHIQKVLKSVSRGPTNEHQDTWIEMGEGAFVFDLFHDALAEADRKAIVEWLNAHLPVYTTDESAFHNSTLSKIYCYLNIAYATWGENPKAEEFRDYALVKLFEGKVLPGLKRFGEGGGWTECGWYSRGSVWHLVQALELARRFEGYDGFAKADEFFNHRMAYELHAAYPGRWIYGTERYAVEGDGSDVYGGHTEYPRHIRTVLAQYFRGSELAGFVAAKRRKGSNLMARMTDLLWEEEPDPARDLSGFPKSHLAAGIGRAYARSDWSDDAAWLRFECGDFWNAHQHFEAGNFEIFRREPLATESGEYTDYMDSHSINWLTRTIAHNCLLVYDPDETWTRMRDGGRNKVANDGGQAKKWDWPPDSLAAWDAHRSQFERGKILAFQDRPECFYAAGDCTAAYSPAKLALWVRQIVFLRPATFVVFDRVVSRKPELEKTWLLHCRNEPRLDGPHTAIVNGKATLDVQTLLPTKAVVRKVEGYTYRGQTFDPKRSALSDVANRWRIEVQPDAPRTEDLFLHVLSADGPVTATLVREQERIGVRIGDTVMLFGGTCGGEVTVGGKRIALTPEVKPDRFS